MPAMNSRDVPGGGWRAELNPCWVRESSGRNCKSQMTGPRRRDHVGMHSQSMTQVEIKSVESQQWPYADVHLTDSRNHAVAYGSGLDPRARRMLEHGAQQ